MSEFGTLNLERLNNGAHFLFISNVLARAEADANVKSKLSAQIVSLKAAMSKRMRTWKSRKKYADRWHRYSRCIKDYAIDPKMQLDKETGH